jgi:dTMP kinase
MLFVSFEGGEGSGKTTCVRCVEHLLRASEVPVHRFSEPGSTPIGHKLREILLYRSANPADAITPLAELFLFCASRAQFTETTLKPLMESGEEGIILCDRYADSTMAYQRFGRGLPAVTVFEAAQDSMNGVRPHLTLFLDVVPETALARLDPTKSNRLDLESMAFHARVYQGYEHMIRKDTQGRWHRLDATQAPDIVAAQAVQVIWERYKAKKGSRA